MTKRTIVVAMTVLLCAGRTQAVVDVIGDVTPFDSTTWSYNLDVIVGDTGSGSVGIDGGSARLGGRAYFGKGPGSTGAGTVSGAGSTWNMAYQLYVGDSGDGTLEIINGGTVTNNYAYLGNEIGSSGAVTVSGAGSYWDFNNYVAVGRYGDGTLAVTNGGRVACNQAIIGQYEEGTGSARVTGVGSVWHIHALLEVGYSGGGTGGLTIAGGGLVHVRTELRIRGNSVISMATGGMLVIQGHNGNSADSIDQFLLWVNGTDNIRYWDDDTSQWAHISEGTNGTDYTLELMTEGDLDGYTVLTVGEIPEPATLLVMGCGAAGLLRRRRSRGRKRA